jgi:hypothetical protein
MVEAIRLTDLGRVLLIKGNTHLNLVVFQDGKETLFGKEKEIEVLDKDFTVRAVTSNQVISHYEDAEGSALSVDKYGEELFKLESVKVPGRYEDDDTVFKNLDDEYAWKKFVQRWSPIYRQVTTYGDPLPVEWHESVVETGSEFITPMFAVGGDPLLFIYHKRKAQLAFAHEELNKINHKWENSNHSGITYVKIEDKYVFTQSGIDTETETLRGTLESMRESLEADKDSIKKAIKRTCSLQFGDVSKGNFIDLVKKIDGATKTIRSRASGLDVKSRAYDDKLSLLRGIKELEEIIDQFIEEKVDSE